MWMQLLPENRMSYPARSMDEYRGKITRASCPNRRSAFDRPATTSARPPNFAKGAHSEATIKILKYGATAFAASEEARVRRAGLLFAKLFFICRFPTASHSSEVVRSLTIDCILRPRAEIEMWLAKLLECVSISIPLSNF
jgi:hypothetical protein